MTPEAQSPLFNTPHAAIRDFAEGDQVEGYYARRESSLRETRSGGQFIRLTLGDASGTVPANVWQKTEDDYADIGEQYQALAGAEVLKVRGAVESYRDALQVKIARIRPAEMDEVDLAALVPHTPADLDALVGELQQAIDSLQDPDYAALLHAIFDDAAFLDAFRRAPAARNNHHAYVGGLLEHTASLLRVVDRYTQLTPGLRRDLLVTGAILHDIGKVEELHAGVSIEYTDEGSLLGHLTQGILFLEGRLRDLPDFPREKRNLIYHLILSHHGRYEYGSPVLPAIPEALALHHIDNLDAKVYAATKAIREDTRVDSNWTERSWMLETRLYKG